MDSGKKLSDIKPGELKERFGGRFDRHSRLLSEAKEIYSDRNVVPAPKMPGWFQESVSELTTKFESIWASTISKHIRETVDAELSGFEVQKAEMQSDLDGQLDQITQLEDQVEALTDDLAEGNKTIESQAQKIVDLEKDSGGFIVEISGLKEQRSDLRETASNERSKAFAIENENERMREKIESLIIQLSNAKSNLDRAATDFDGVSTNRDKLSQELKSKQAEIADHKEQIIELKSESKSLSKESTAKQSELDKANDVIKGKDQDLVVVRSERDKLAGRLEALKKAKEKDGKSE
jgi:chromosome segregation ATPase